MKHPRWLPLLGLPAAVFLLASAPMAVADTATPGAATYLDDDETCLGCHEEMALPRSQIHARIESFEVRGRAVGCEGCHGPGSLHSEETDPELIRGFAAGGLGDDACMSCHLAKGLAEWHASTHSIEGVGCSDCHTVHPAAADAAPASPFDACRSCHADVLAQFELPSHHPVREGKMDCAGCHDVHSANERLLISDLRPNDTCFECHQNIEGPYIFEHEPVQEDCRTCHLPHGSVANTLLTMNQPALCLQCHEFHFHAAYRASEDHEVDIGGFERENPFGPRSYNIAVTTSCTQCHAKIHGSDLPSQSVPGQGRGLIH